MSLSDISANLRQTWSASGRSLNGGRDPAARLGSRINTVLMVFNQRLYDLDNGRWVLLADTAVDTATEAQSQPDSAVQLARAAARLLRESRADNNPGRDHKTGSVLLLLPPARFLATTVDLPGVAPAAVRSALQLQADSLLPGYDEPLSLAVNANNPAASASGPRSHTVFWITAAAVDALFDAFADENLLLAALMPRPAAVAGGDNTLYLHDCDEHHAASLLVTGHVITACLHTTRHDLEDEAFASQWQADTNALQLAAEQTLNLHSAEDYLACFQKHGQPARQQLDLSYAIYPRAALTATHQFDKGKRLWQAAAVVAVLVFASCIPFLLQSLQLADLRQSLAQTRELAAPARADQMAVREFESRWGVLTEYPEQNVPQVLLTLQEVISPNVLSALDIDQGYVSIEGESADPQSLLRQLEQTEMFTEVDFARAINNSRYYIDLRLTTVNFPAYFEWYFPESI